MSTMNSLPETYYQVQAHEYMEKLITLAGIHGRLKGSISIAIRQLKNPDLFTVDEVIKELLDGVKESDDEFKKLYGK